jgi:hypothetical protein
MSQRKNSPLPSQKGGKTNQHLGPSLNWIQCDKCQGWDLFENSGIGGKFNEKVLCSVKFDCRLCRMERCVDGVVDKVREVEGTVAEVKGRVEKLEGEIAEKMKEATTEVEGKLSAVCDNELGMLRGTVEELQGRMKDVEVEVDSRVAVGEGRCEEKIGVLERSVGEVKDGLHALVVKVEDLSGDWELVRNRKKERSAGAAPVNVCAESVSIAHQVQDCTVRKLTFAEVVQNKSVRNLTFVEKVKAKGVGTVFLVGDSLVRGVGKKLEAQCGSVFSSRSIGGARIEDVTEVISKLEAGEDRHLVVLVGTNNIQKDGSEEVLTKFHSLIEGCKVVRNRMVTVVGIPRRFDVTSLQENRRLGVNVRLSRMCREAGVQYVEYEADKSRICADRVHFNALGQSEVAGMIFRHCRNFLL